MASYNRVILVGNLTRDPEVKYIPSGDAICEFSLAINDSYKKKDGTKIDKAVFVECKAWGKTGETIKEYFSKGRSILVEGKLQMDQWDDKETGKKRSKLYVTVHSFAFIEKKGTDSSTQHAPPSNGEESQVSSAEAMSPHEDEVPF